MRTYAGVAGNARVNVARNDIMDEEEAVKAATAALGAPDNQRSSAHDAAPPVAPATQVDEAPKMAAQAAAVEAADEEAGEKEEVVLVEPEPKESEPVEEKEDKEPGEEESDDDTAMEVRPGSSKRPRERGEEAVAAQRLRSVENEWKKATGKKGKYVPAHRSSSLDRDQATRNSSGERPPPRRK